MNLLKIIISVIIVWVGLCGARDGNTWQVIGKMPHPVYGGQAVTIDSLIYIFGGYSDSLRGPADLIQIYNPVNDQWKTGGHLLEPRYGFILNQLDEHRIMSVGGIWNETQIITSAELWNTFNTSGSPAEILTRDTRLNRIYATGHIYNKKYYLIGGLSSTMANTSLANPFILIFDIGDSPDTNAPDSINQNEYITYHHTSVLLDTTIYMFGGVNFGVSGRINALNVMTNRLRPAGRMLGVRAGAVSVVYEKSIYIIGGYSESPQPINDVEIFRPNKNSSEKVSQLNYGRKEPMAAVYKNTIYVFGGSDRQGNSIPAVEKLDLISNIRNKSGINPGIFKLIGNYPNPFNTGTTIEFKLDTPEAVKIDIYSITGAHIRTLVIRDYPVGIHKIYWDGRDSTNRYVSSGVYVCRISNKDQSQQMKMILLR